MKNVILIGPNDTCEVKGIMIETIPSYNINKKFHPRTNEWV